MAKIPKRDVLKELLEEEQVLQEFRPYIGMSGLLGHCPREIWYNFHWSCDRFIAKRVARIFERGDLEEARVVFDLTKIGIVCTEVLDDQIELVDETGHIKGHPDGKASRIPTAPKTIHLLEVKTMKDSLYKTYLKKGLKVSHPAYWGQVHTYMGKEGLKRCLFVATNKDTEERHYERIKYDKEVHDQCMSIGFDILTAEHPPKKIGDATWFECKWCACKGICHKGEPIKKTCRSCKHVNIEMEGRWSCSKNDWDLNYDAQMLACEDYELSEVYE